MDEEERFLNARTRIIETLWQIKYQQSYIEEMIEMFKARDLYIKVISTFVAVVGVAVLFAEIKMPYKGIVFVITILGQFTTFLYPIIFKYDDKIKSLTNNNLHNIILGSNISVDLRFDNLTYDTIVAYQKEADKIYQMSDWPNLSKKKADKFNDISNKFADDYIDNYIGEI